MVVRSRVPGHLRVEPTRKSPTNPTIPGLACVLRRAYDNPVRQGGAIEKNINFGRVILGGIVAGIVGDILGFVVDGVILAPQWAAGIGWRSVV